MTRRLLTVDFANTVLFCEEAAQAADTGSAAHLRLSSVAGERGRKPVILYGAAKAGLTRYLEGLDHRYRSEGLQDDLRQARVRADVDDRGSADRHRSPAIPTQVAATS